ncbi:EAL and HDOD domain-containing protein [Stieleria varia]|uniref:HDOD domain protein n=1 Tax=Stieleria varia TaxID=2528005 RepID=A0A5C6B0J4_9BACT|nr:HDOD domain-containing protein [Stieleria varia]TWU04979.1 HDOD domain protein [Stieleria varia]
MDRALVGRQPIFSSSLDVYGYELLFRSGEENSARFCEGDRATANVILNTFTDIGLETLAGSKCAFINLTRNLLLARHLSCLPADRVVLEVLEDIQPDRHVLAAVAEYSELGYTIALDDFIYREELEPLIDLADIVKVEFPAIPSNELADHISKLRDRGIQTILAEKIETQEEFERCRELGCDLFQGYFFCKPQVISGRRVNSNIASVVRLLSALQDPDITTERVEEVIQTDANLSYKLLQFVNSANAATRRRIDSLRQATALMGIQRLRSLVSMMLLSNVDETKPNELINIALMRAKMCELLAIQAGEDRPERFYTLGLFSTLDALLDQPMSEIVKMLPLTNDTNDALLNRSGTLGDVLSCVINYESGNVTTLANVNRAQVAQTYEETLQWLTTNSLRA